MHVNLLPRSLQWKVLLRIRGRQWAAVWGVIAALAVGIGAFRYVDATTKMKQLAAIEGRCQSLRAVESEAEELGLRLVTLKQQAAALAAFQPEQRSIALLGIVAHNAMRTDGRLQINRMSFQTATEPATQALSPNLAATPPPKRPEAVERSTLQLHGVAADDRTVGQFVEGLRQASVFERVELKSSSELRTPGRSGRQFQLECRF